MRGIRSCSLGGVSVRVVDPAYLLGRSVLSEMDGQRVVLLVSRDLSPSARTAAVRRATGDILGAENDRELTGS